MELDTSGRAGRAGLGRQMPAVLGELVGQAAGAVNAEETRLPLVREVLVCKHDAVH